MFLVKKSSYFFIILVACVNLHCNHKLKRVKVRKNGSLRGTTSLYSSISQSEDENSLSSPGVNVNGEVVYNCDNENFESCDIQETVEMVKLLGN